MSDFFARTNTQINNLELLVELSERIAAADQIGIRPVGQRFSDLVDANIVRVDEAGRKELARHFVKVLELRKNQLS